MTMDRARLVATILLACALVGCAARATLPAATAQATATPQATATAILSTMAPADGQEAERLVSQQIDAPVTIDGEIDDAWAQAKPLRVPLTWGADSTEHALDVELRALHTGNSTRQRQGLGLLDALAELEATGHAVATLAAGDFNTWSARETVIKHFQRGFPQSPAWDGLPTRGSYPTDFIFFRESAAGTVRMIEGSHRRLDDRYGSDHFARIARFTFAP